MSGIEAWKKHYLSGDEHVRLGQDVILDDRRHDPVHMPALLMHVLRRKVGRDELAPEYPLRVLLQVP